MIAHSFSPILCIKHLAIAYASNMTFGFNTFNNLLGNIDLVWFLIGKYFSFMIMSITPVEINTCSLSAAH